MAAESKTNTTSTDHSQNKKRKQRYLPHNRAVRKGCHPLRPGVQGFFLTCDGGKERQASREAIDVIDSFYEDLIKGNDSAGNPAAPSNKPLNKKIKFSYCDSSSSDDADKEESEKEGEVQEEENQLDTHRDDDADKCPTNENSFPSKVDNVSHEIHSEERTYDDDKVHGKNDEHCANGAEELPAKKQCFETDTSKSGNVCLEKVEKSIDQLIDDEIKELGDRNKRRFSSLDSGCNGVSFVQMRKSDGDPRPNDIVQHMMTSASKTRKHMSRFILRVLPVEVACYASEEEITRAIQPIIAEYFPVETQTPLKFAVLYDARANTGVERMKIINAVAKSVPAPHKVDLNHPDKTIVVQIVKTVCLIGVVEKYKELAKYNLRQLTSPKQ